LALEAVVENACDGETSNRADFVVNQIGHPYQGSNYFNTGQ
jgi:hypothetical protein